MTLTSILPTLRRTLPDPLRSTQWPDHTEATPTDIVVAGVSLLRLIELCESPCVHSGDASTPGSRATVPQDASVVIVRVTAVVTNSGADRVVLIDACLDTVAAIWDETRLLGRASTAYKCAAIILAGESGEVPPGHRRVVELPDDLREGDLLAIPCRGTVALHDVRPRTESSIDAAVRGNSAWLGTLA